MKTTIEEMQSALLENARIGFAQVLDGTSEEYKNSLLCGSLVNPILLDLNCEESGEPLDTNGWQMDWWQDYIYQDTNYTLSGSGWYGGISFHKSDKQ